MFRNLVTGNFDVENFWRDENLANLPFIPDKNTDYVNEGMQELLFIFCDRDDLLVTSYPFYPELKRYLHSIGLCFQADSIQKHNPLNAPNENIIKKIEENGIWGTDDFSGAHLKLFGDLPDAKQWCERMGMVYHQPPMPVTVHVNSKEFSHQVRCKLGTNYRSQFIHSAEELYRVGSGYLEAHQNFLVKDLFGVSGKGNLFISTAGILDRVSKHLKRQEMKGKQIRFLVEEELDKQFDFSCVIEIEDNGKVHCLTVQKISIKNLAYTGTMTPEQEFLALLEKSDYYTQIQKAGEMIYKAGYYGYVCFDSMCLKDGTIIPIVEINARYSMTQIKWMLDQKVGCPSHRVSMLSSVTLNEEQIKNFAFQSRGMQEFLFHHDGKTGVIPLSANAVCCPGNTQTKGKFYYYLMGKSYEQLKELQSAVKNFFSALNN